MTNHTDTSRSGDLVAPTLSVVGNFVPPSAVVFFDGDSVIRINRNGTLELGPKWADAGDAATAFFNELLSRIVPSWNARIEALTAENERLRELLVRGYVVCDGNDDDAVAFRTEARAALGEKQ